MAAMPRDAAGDDAHHVVEGVEHRLLAGHGDVVVAVALDHQRADRLLDLLRRVGGEEGRVDLGDLFEVEDLHRGGDRNVDGVVDVEADHLALRLEDADHPETRPGDAHEAAQGVLLAEQLALHGGPDDASCPP